MDHVVKMAFHVSVHSPATVEAPEEPTIQANAVGIHVDRQELREVRGTRSSDGGQGLSRGRGWQKQGDSHPVLLRLLPVWGGMATPFLKSSGTRTVGRCKRRRTVSSPYLLRRLRRIV